MYSNFLLLFCEIYGKWTTSMNTITFIIVLDRYAGDKTRTGKSFLHLLVCVCVCVYHNRLFVVWKKAYFAENVHNVLFSPIKRRFLVCVFFPHWIFSHIRQARACGPADRTSTYCPHVKWNLLSYLSLFVCRITVAGKRSLPGKLAGCFPWCNLKALFSSFCVFWFFFFFFFQDWKRLAVNSVPFYIYFFL